MLSRIILLTAMAVSTITFSLPATSSPVTQFCGDRVCPTLGAISSQHAGLQPGVHGRIALRRANVASALNEGAGEARRGDIVVLGGRPSSCAQKPHRTAHLWCGCASAIEAGVPNEDGFWDLAAHWVQYMPSTTPAPGMAHATSGHVNILRSQVAGSIWRVYDPNNRNRAILQDVDISRGHIVDPHAARVHSYAELQGHGAGHYHHVAHHHHLRYARR